MSEKDRQEDSADGEVKSLSVTPALTALVKPTAEYVGNELRDYVKATVEEWKAKRREKNIKSHVDGVRQKLETTPTEDAGENARFLQLSLFDEWLDHVQDVDPNDEKLSEIWQNLLVSAARGQGVREEVLSALKNLSPREAHFLARRHERVPTVPLISGIVDAEDRYLAKELEERRIVEKDYSFPVLLFLSLALSGVAVYTVAETVRIKAPPIVWIAPIMTALALLAVSLRSGLTRWRLTWLGRQLVAYLPTGRGEKQQTSAQQGAPADAAKPGG